VVNADSSKPTLLSYLVADISLLLMMLLGLSRLRIEGGMFGLGCLLWRQVWLWQFLLIVVLTTQCDVCCQGYHVARARHHSRGTAISTLGILPAHLIVTHHDFILQIYIFLNINGIFLFSPAYQRFNFD
jgi:hypothetical protein